MLGSINSHINIVQNFKNCAYLAPSKHDSRLRQPHQQNLHQRQAESRLENEELYGSQREPALSVVHQNAVWNAAYKTL